MSRFPSLEVLPSQNSWTLALCLDFRTSVSPLIAVAPTELSDVWKSQVNAQCAARLPNGADIPLPFEKGTKETPSEVAKHLADYKV